MSYIIRDCLKHPLINIKPSELDIEHLKNMRKFIHNNIEIYSNKYFFNNCKVGYVGITGNTLKNIINIDFNLYTLDIDINNNPDFVIDLTKNNDNIVEDNFFDILICTEVLEHTKNPIACLDELYRMLKANGKLFLSTPYNFRIHGPLPDNFRFTEWFYKDILPSKNFKILSIASLEKSNRKLCPIDYFITAEKIIKNKKLKGLVFPSGSGVAIEIYESLKNHKDIELVFANSEKISQTNNLIETKYDDLPYFDKNMIDDLIRYLNNLITLEKLDFIIPTMDIGHFYLSKFADKINCKIITSQFNTNMICIDKEKTYNYLQTNIKCPKIIDIQNINEINYPVFIKPKEGYSSKECYLINNKQELEFYYNNKMLVTEYLPGKEYTVDCITNKNKLIYLNPRERRLTRAGLSVITDSINKETDLYDKILAYGKNINSLLSFKGSWFFQIKMDNNGEITLLEVSTRIAGASSINRLNNVNLALISIYTHFNYPISIIENNIPNLSVSKIYKSMINIHFLKSIENIYIDFDDTLIVNKNVNYELISLIYKFNNSKNIYLITRHKGNIEKSLKYYNIDMDLFSSIYHIKNNESKKHIIKNNSIFFDDSFKERKSCLNKNNIYVFDVDAISLFI